MPVAHSSPASATSNALVDRNWSAEVCLLEDQARGSDQSTTIDDVNNSSIVTISALAPRCARVQTRMAVGAVAWCEAPRLLHAGQTPAKASLRTRTLRLQACASRSHPEPRVPRPSPGTAAR